MINDDEQQAFKDNYDAHLPLIRELINADIRLSELSAKISNLARERGWSTEEALEVQLKVFEAKRREGL